MLELPTYAKREQTRQLLQKSFYDKERFVNQLNRSLLLNPKMDEGKPPYLIVRIWTGTQGVPGR